MPKIFAREDKSQAPVSLAGAWLYRYSRLKIVTCRFNVAGDSRLEFVKGVETGFVPQSLQKLNRDRFIVQIAVEIQQMRLAVFNGIAFDRRTATNVADTTDPFAVDPRARDVDTGGGQDLFLRRGLIDRGKSQLLSELLSACHSGGEAVGLSQKATRYGYLTNRQKVSCNTGADHGFATVNRHAMRRDDRHVVRSKVIDQGIRRSCAKLTKAIIKSANNAACHR